MPLSNRIYPMATLQAAHRRADLAKVVAFVHAQEAGSEPLLEDLAGRVERLYFEDRTLVAEVMFLRNANGLIGELMCEKGVRWAPSGFGSLVNNIVQTDYELLFISPWVEQFQSAVIKDVFRQKARQSRGVKTIQSDPADQAP